MEQTMPELNKIYQGDCLEIMRGWPDKCIDLTLTDPPYGIGADKGQKNRAGLRHGNAAAPSRDYGDDSWDNAPPGPEYFKEILRVSKNAIIFGGNYFASHLPNSSCWIVWDKNNGDNGYADCELAWTSFPSAVRRIHYRWAGMLQENMKEKEERFHPTQKPVAVMEWALTKYSQAGQTILDPFCGSGSSLLAAERIGRKWVGIERESKYVEIARSRVSAESAQEKLF